MSAAQSSILVFDLDPQSGTYRQQIKALTTDQATYGIRATSDPNVVLFTNFLSDETGFGIIRGAESAAPSVEQYSLEFENTSPTIPFAVHNAEEVAVTPDGLYAFVAGFNWPDPYVASKDHSEPADNPAEDFHCPALAPIDLKATG